MRQVGVVAAACIVALEQMVKRLAEDHANARKLAEWLAQLPQLDIDASGVETNIVLFSLREAKITARQLTQRLAEEGVLLLTMGADKVRAVTHYGIEEEDIDKTLAAFSRVLMAQGAASRSS